MSKMSKISETSETFETIVTNDGSKIEIIKTMYRNTPQGIKFSLAVYLLVSVGFYITYNYTDGANALKHYRSTKNTVTWDRSKELDVIRNSINYFTNFVDALLFPWSMSAKIIPNIILAFNPPPN